MPVGDSEHLPLVLAKVEAIADDEECEEFTEHRKHQAVSSAPSPSGGRTMRRIALLNTLLFLGLAMAHQDVQVADGAGGMAAVPPSTMISDARSDIIDTHETSSAVLDQANSFDDDSDDEYLTTMVDDGLSVLDGGTELERRHLHASEFHQYNEDRGDHEHPNVIVVVSVDGSLAGLDKKTGETIWKQTGAGITTSQPHSNLNSFSMKQPPHSSSFFQPLVATTTTTRSASSTSDNWRTVAVPAVDGQVFLTTATDKTITSTAKELVARAPFVDARGRFYVGSRHSTAVALDGGTGEVLRVLPDGMNKDIAGESLPSSLEGRNVVWVGRVDYSISVHEARTGTTDVEFSVADVISVTDMVLDSGGNDNENPGESLDSWASSSLSSNKVSEAHFAASDTGVEVAASTSSLVATPSGHVAYRDPQTGHILWVACESFDTPVVFALDSATGQSIQVEIIPDAPVPDSASTDYLTQAFERQLKLIDGSDDDARGSAGGGVASDGHEQPTIIGALSSGQLFAMPLGHRRNSGAVFSSTTATGSTTKHHMTMSSAATTSKQNALASLPQIVRPHNPNLHHQTYASNSQEGNGDLYNQNQPQQGHQQQSVSAKKPCKPSASNFPGCLVGSTQRKADHHHFARGGPNGDILISESAPGLMINANKKLSEGGGGYGGAKMVSEDGSVAITKHTNPDAMWHYHPEYGYVQHSDGVIHHHGYYQYAHPHHQQQQQHSRSKHYKMLRILGSWLPPTIALIFVLSFELGRRKRQKDNQQRRPFADPAALLDKAFLHEMDTNVGLLPPSSQSERQKQPVSIIPSQPFPPPQQHVIQVDDEILGYGGQGTVVYKGRLEGRHVAVKRLLKAYHASAEREISLLIESDGHPNVVRYFLKEMRGDFVYLALELCDLSLHDLINTLRSHAASAVPHQPDDMPVAQAAQDSTALLAASRDVNAFSAAARKVLFQIASGVKHLHSLRIVHRDLKPANILLAMCTSSTSGSKNSSISQSSQAAGERNVYEKFLHGDYVAKISDMGLGKQLVGQSSYGASHYADGASLRVGGSKGASSVGGVGPGSVGWQAPEVMSMKWQATSDSSTDAGRSSLNGAVGASGEGAGASSSTGASPILETDVAKSQSAPRTSRSVDIFSLGCIFYSTLVPGCHPFGEWYEREANIMHNRPSIEALARVSADAYDLVRGMIHRNPKQRPTAQEICDHPFFWTSQRRLAFICDISDRVESDITTRTVPSSKSSTVFVDNPLILERGAANVVGTAWDKALDDVLINNVQRFRTYDPSSVRDLLRLIRNKHHHFDELPRDFRSKLATTNLDNFQTKAGLDASIGDKTAEEGLWEYFEARFPLLLMHCYQLCRQWLPSSDPLASKYSITPLPNIPIAGAPTLISSVPISCGTSQEEGRISKTERVTDVESDIAGGPTVVESDASALDPEQHECHSQNDENSKHEPSEVGDLVSISSSSGFEVVTDVDGGTTPAQLSERSISVESAVTNESFVELKKSPDEEQEFHREEAPAAPADHVSSDTKISSAILSTDTTAPEVVKMPEVPDDIILWEGSTAARTFNSRGWYRSDEEWTRRDSGSRKIRDPNLARLAEDPKFRTRLCNHWDESWGVYCPMRRKNKCVFAHGPVELRVKEGKRNRWGKLVDKLGNNSNPCHSGGEDTFGAAKSIETVRKVEGKWNTKNKKKAGEGGKKQQSQKQGGKKKKPTTQ